MKFETRLLHTGFETDPATGAATVPIYQASTFHQASLDAPGRWDYARSGNPTRQAAEDALTALEGGARGCLFASGMAALSSTLLLFSSGDHLIVTDDCYGGTYRVLTRVFHRLGISASFVDTADPAAVAAAIRPNTKALLLETLSNPFLKVTDIAACAAIARERRLLTIVDNTLLSPYLCRPLELGADLVIHSATKFLGGHSDLIAGAAVAATPELGNELYFIQNAVGAVLGPQDCFLLQRGLKTLSVRLARQQTSALTVAQALADHPAVARVHYPGLAADPGHAVLERQSAGAGALLAFALRDPALLRPFVAALKLPLVGVSLGAVETILTVPVLHSHASVPAAQRAERGITESLLRLSVGLEDPADLIADLTAALDAAL